MPYITEHFAEAGFECPENISLTCGWPSKMGLGRKKMRIGECWDSKAATDGKFHIFISPVLDKPVQVVGVLIHEIVHAVVGLKAGHKKPFARCAAAVGLVKPWTATTETPELKAKIRGWVDLVGPYPHGALKPKVLAKEGEKGRLLLMECDCGLKIRTTRTWLDTYGTEWPCPCGAKLVSAA